MAFEAFVEGLESLQQTRGLTPRIRTAAARAVNATATRTRTASDRAIRQQVNFPASYMSPSSGRLVVHSKASAGNLEARIRARQRPTSLARFSASLPRGGQGVTVQVQPGRTKFMKRAFFIRLRAGAGVTETKFNLGLAIRLRPGERLINKKQAIRMANGLYLLYGPSVDQVFRTVAEDESPAAARFLEAEFLRQLAL